MTSGKKHEQSTQRWSLPFGLLIGVLLDAKSGVISATAFFTGGLWLSPDLDTNSLPLKRWGVLQGLWWPYKKVIPHRSIFSHGPFIGTALRVGYLLSLTMILIFLIQPIGLSNFGFLDVSHFISDIVQQHPKHCFAVLLGFEASAWLHLIKDGDPFLKRGRKRQQ